MSSPIKNRIILGLMTFGPEGSGGARVTSLETFKACLDHFQSKGYNEVDTARVYCSGKQEDWLSQAGWRERGLTVATKWYPWQKGEHRAEILKAKIDESLKELRTDCLDIFYLHGADRATPFAETLKAVDEAHKAGKFKTFAISNFTASEVAEVCLTCHFNGWIRPTLYQGCYNVLCRGAELDLIPTLRRFGLDYCVYNPLAGGFLSGKFTSKERSASGRFAEDAAYATMYRGRYFKDLQFEALGIIEEAADKHGLTIIECAYRWLVHHSALRMRQSGGSDGILVGASSLEQLKQNLDLVEKGPLPDDVAQAMDGAWKHISGSAPYYFQGHGEPVYDYDTIEALYGKSK